MRAVEPVAAGFVERDGVKVHWQEYGAGEPTILFLPTWSIIDSRFWKAQVPYLSRHFRVVTFDGRGTGRSDRPSEPEAYSHLEFAADTLAVLDATDTPDAVLVGLSCGTLWGVQVAADHPGRVRGLISLGPQVPLAPTHPDRTVYAFAERLDTTDGWAKYNRYHWMEGGYRDFLEFFAREACNEPHSTKQIDDFIEWALDTEPAKLVASDEGMEACGLESFRSVCARVRAPVLVIHGDDDELAHHARGAALASVTGGELISVAGGGHLLQAREPVLVNRAIKRFVDRLTPGAPIQAKVWTRSLSRRKRALFLSSPIGLGHARRDVAIAKELKQLRPDVEIDWLAQHPVTAVLEAEGEQIHPASRWLANESAHMASESSEHDLHCFQALRNMDEILLANFMLFQEVVEEGLYDVLIGDEAWDVDHFWHENPELKRGQHVWLTDFVGFLPMPDGGAREADLTTDYNAEMIEHIARYPWIRDRSIFVGKPDDIVADRFGGELPTIRDWTEEHFAFSGYITGFTPPSAEEVGAWRAELGYEPDELVCVVAVGGSGVGRALLDKVIAAYPLAKRQLPALRMIAVAGPRIDPGGFPSAPGLEVRGYVDRLYRHLSVCDLAVVQGGLTTTMELAAAKRPFLYFPLRNHFEQNFHVRHRLDRYGAGRCMDYGATDPDLLAEAICDTIGRPVAYRDVETDGAAMAAQLIAELV